MKGSDNSTSKIYISINFILSISLLIMIDTLLLILIIEMKSVYSAIRAGSLNKAVCALSLKG